MPISGKEALVGLFDECSDAMEEAGGWGHGRSFSWSKGNIKLKFRACLEEYAGKCEYLKVYGGRRLLRRKVLGSISSSQPAMNGKKDMSVYLAPDAADSIIALYNRPK